MPDAFFFLRDATVFDALACGSRLNSVAQRIVDCVGRRPRVTTRGYLDATMLSSWTRAPIAQQLEKV